MPDSNEPMELDDAFMGKEESEEEEAESLEAEEEESAAPGLSVMEMAEQLDELKRKLEESEREKELLENVMARTGKPLTRQKVKPTPIPKDLDEGPSLGEQGEYLPAKYVTRRGNIREDH